MLLTWAISYRRRKWRDRFVVDWGEPYWIQCRESIGSHQSSSHDVASEIMLLHITVVFLVSPPSRPQQQRKSSLVLDTFFQHINPQKPCGSNNNMLFSVTSVHYSANFMTDFLFFVVFVFLFYSIQTDKSEERIQQHDWKKELWKISSQSELDRWNEDCTFDSCTYTSE